MWTSAKDLLRGVVRHWLQLVSGAFMALIALVAAVQEWTVPPGVWWTASGLLVAWAILLEFHAVNTRRKELQEALEERQAHQALADELTAKHRQATHAILNQTPLNGADPGDKWRKDVHKWYQEVLEIMRRHNCSAQEFNHVETINQIDIRRLQYLSEIGMFIIRLDRVADISRSHSR